MTTTITATSTGSITAAAGVADTVKFSAPWSSVRITNLSGSVMWVRSDGQTAVAGAAGTRAVMPGIPLIYTQQFDGLGADTINPISIISTAGGAYTVEGINFTGGLAQLAALNDMVSALAAKVSGMPRALIGAAGTWVAPTGGQSTATGTASASARITYSPLFLATATRFDRQNCVPTAAAGAGSTANLGIYANATGDVPGALLLNSGSVATTSTGSREAVIDVTLQPGIYWLACSLVGVTTTGTFRTLATVSMTAWPRGTGDPGSTLPLYGQVVAGGALPAIAAADLTSSVASAWYTSLRVAA